MVMQNSESFWVTSLDNKKKRSNENNVTPYNDAPWFHTGLFELPSRVTNSVFSNSTTQSARVGST